MPDAMINPPLVGFYLAAIAALVGWSEMALHIAQLPFSILSIVGLYMLAKKVCRFPLVPPLLMLVCPAFLVSATTLMCDVPMLCLWIWAVVLWSRGSIASVVLAGGLVALAVMTKYTAICLLPLLIAQGLIYPPAMTKVRRIQFFSLLIPVAIILFYDQYTTARYGRPLFFDAIGYSSATTADNPIHLMPRMLDGIIFLGGGALIIGVTGFIVCSHRFQILLLIAVPVTAWIAGRLFAPQQHWQDNWDFRLQAGCFATAGVIILIACIAGPIFSAIRGDAIEQRQTIFLLLWTAGVFIFATALNWSINCRTILPLIPPVTILGQRWLERHPIQHLRPLLISAAAATTVAILVTVADYQTAIGNREVARYVAKKFAGRNIWFTGHWGFQYYMQLIGAQPADEVAPICRDRDILVVALNNYGVDPPRVGKMPLDAFTAQSCPFLTTQNQSLLTGFYFSAGDRLPYRFGNNSSDRFEIMQVTGTSSTLHLLNQFPLGQEKTERNIDKNQK